MLESKSWIIIFAMAVIMAVNSIYLFIKFEEDRIVGPVYFVISAATAYVVWQYFRFGVIWAWYSTLIFPVSFLVVTVAFIIMKKPSMALYYGIATAVLFGVQFWNYREFFK